MKWEQEMTNSPYGVDLVAEDERIQEENRIRVAEEQEKYRRIREQKEKAKNDIILKVECNIINRNNLIINICFI